MLNTIFMLRGNNRWSIVSVVNGKPTVDEIVITIRTH